MTGRGRMLTVGPGQGAEFRIGADRLWTKGDASQRSEAFAVVEYEGGAGVPGPPSHLHRSFEEACYILEGRVEFRSKGRTIHAGVGTYLFVPRGVPHTFQVEGSKPACWIGIFSPAKYVGLLEELGSALPPKGRPDLVALAELFTKYDTALC